MFDRLFFISLCMAVIGTFAVFVSRVHALPPSPGEEIVNSSFAFYTRLENNLCSNNNEQLKQEIFRRYGESIESLTGKCVAISNSLKAVVIEKVAISVEKDQEVYLPKGKSGAFYFSVKNTGNVPLQEGKSVRINLENMLNELEEIKIYEDPEVDGIVEDGQKPLSGNGEEELVFDVGQRRHYIVHFKVPFSYNIAERAAVKFTALIPSDSVSESAVGSVITVDESLLSLVKKVDSETAAVGEELKYTLSLTSGVRKEFGYSAVTLDGLVKRGVHIKDPLPRHTVFNRVLSYDNKHFQPIYHLRGMQAQAYTKKIPVDKTEIDAVAFFLVNSKEISAQSAADFSFFVTVQPSGLGKVVVNEAELFVDSGGNPTNKVSTKIVPIGDVVRAPDLFLKKDVSNDRAEIGDFVSYTITVKNKLKSTISDLKLKDALPVGFDYQEGSGVITVKDSHGSVLGSNSLDHLTNLDSVVNFDSVPPEGELVFTYMVKVGAMSSTGSNVNLASLVGSRDKDGVIKKVYSNQAKASLTVVRDSVFDNRAGITGRVYLVCDSGSHPVKKVGIPGVRLLFENGTSVYTDKYGRYSIYGFRAVTHVAKIDPTTLPENASVKLTNNRQAFDADTRFIDLKTGELHNANFAVGPCSEDILEKVSDRVKAFKNVNNLEKLIDSPIDLRPHSVNTGPLSNIAKSASSSIFDNLGAKNKNTAAPSNRQAIVSAPESKVRDIQTTVDLSVSIKSMNNDLDFIDLRDGDILRQKQVSIRVKSNSATSLNLLVNGKKVGSERIGQRLMYEAGQVSAFEYIAVPLKVGENDLEIQQIDSFGINRGSKNITVIIPGVPVSAKIYASDVAIADPRSPLPIVVRLFDERGILTSGIYEVTLNSNVGKWNVRDIDEYRSGLQTIVDDGEAIFDFIPPDNPGTKEIVVSGLFGSFSRKIKFHPNLRPMIAVGVIEGAINFGSNKQKVTRFIENADLSSFEKTQQGINGALYLKGKVRGDHLLTLSYDSDKDTSERLYRDIRPDEYYPVYGDGSIREFDAQSRSRLYVRVERGSSYILYGDYNTHDGYDGLKLGGYSRNLTGGKVYWENGNVTVNAFVARAKQSQRVFEFPARGISGPYSLGIDDKIVTNSDKVEIIVYDKNNPNIILSKNVKTRFVDYVIGYFDNTIIFTDPVSSFDGDYNPIKIRVTLEIENNAKPYWVYGSNIRYKVNDNVSIGASAIQSNEDGNRLGLRSIYLEANDKKHSKIVIEAAQSDHDVQGSGYGFRGDYSYKSKDKSFNVSLVQTSEKFKSPNYSMSSGKREVKAQLKMLLSPKLWVDAKVSYTGDLKFSTSRSEAKAGLEYLFSKSLTMIGGASFVRITDRNDMNKDVPSIYAGLKWKPVALPGISLFITGEQDVSKSSNRRVVVGGEKVFDKGRFYARHELISNYDAEGIFGSSSDFSKIANSSSNRTAVGVEYNINKDTKAYSEYRDSGLANKSPSPALVLGTKSKWSVAKGLTLKAGFERIGYFKEKDKTEMSVTGGFEYDAPGKSWKARAGIEWYDRSDSVSWYGNIGYVKSINDSWTFLARNRISLVDYKKGVSKRKLLNRLRAGFAYRPVDFSSTNVLGWYEWYVENGTKENGLKKNINKHLWSLSVNHGFSDKLSVTGRYAGKYSKQQLREFNNNLMLQQFSLGLRYNITDRFDLGVNGSVMFRNRFNNPVYSLGFETGYILKKNIWVSVGYNMLGYKEEDLGSETGRGFYIRLRMKFDEDQFNWLQ